MTVFAVGAVCVLLALFALVFLVIAPPPKRVAVERRIAPGAEHVSALQKATRRAVETIEQAAGQRDRRMFGSERLELAGIRSEPSAFLIIVFAVAAVLGLIGVLIGFGTFWAVVLGVLFAAASPLLVSAYLNIRTDRRRARFADQLDDTLQLVAGNLRAGHGLLQAVDSVAQHADSPTTEEFARVVNQTRIGRDLGEALADTAERMRSDDFSWAAQAIQINRETGGNLSETLQRTAATIRERNQIRRQVKALSAEGRLSATVLILLPIVVVAAVLILRPDYLAPFVESPLGWFAIIIAIVLMAVGTFWMSAVVRVKF
ncbi:type II secretion system F family protein [Agromyces sp. H66]|uniref:type II secretion system F family protein n=1 Tax=Agromyces sp. H66 TaxID=2529859 RepID=UPI0010A9EDA3|nr:type II secretion system F family protein [Agromyces sp. H66]